MKNVFRYLSFTFCGLAFSHAFGTAAFAQSSTQFERELKVKTAEFLEPIPGLKNVIQATELLPNGASGSVMVPTGFGGSGFNVFGGIGGSYPQVYTNKMDFAGNIGVTLGNPVSAVNVAVGLNVMDISSFNNYSGNIILSKRIFRGSSISVGGLQLLASDRRSDAPGSTYYVAFSHSVQSLPSKSPGSSRLTFGIGIGSGRFYEKSLKDIANGKGKHGTAVFGNVSYELIRNVNINAEWTGTNLGFSTGIRPFKQPLNLGIGITNLTNYSSDKPNMVFSLGYPLSLTR